MLPKFRYNPNCYENGVFKPTAPGSQAICDRCGRPSEYYHEGMYSAEDVAFLCPHCIADGTAAEKFDGEFVQDAEKIFGNEERTEELFMRTPGLETWQGEYWLAHCNDHCAFIGYVGIEELNEMDITEDVLGDYAETGDVDVEIVRKHLKKKGDMAGYLFRCLHCGKYRLHVDMC